MAVLRTLQSTSPVGNTGDSLSSLSMAWARSRRVSLLFTSIWRSIRRWRLAGRLGRFRAKRPRSRMVAATIEWFDSYVADESSVCMASQDVVKTTSIAFGANIGGL